MDTTPQQSRTDHNVWAAIFADDLLSRARLVGIGFEEGIVVPDEDGVSIHHSELVWPEARPVSLVSHPGLGAGVGGVGRVRSTS